MGKTSVMDGINTVARDIFDHISKVATRGDVMSVIDAIDRYGYDVQGTMNVGDIKGEILDRCVQEAAPKNVLELGTYCGYSAIRMARLLKEGAMVYTVEANPEFAAVAQKVISFAGLD
uniref:catechol O-methyltransferase n=1 Tax=Ciona savignyi TaxID=51511 RepID=H2YJS7_CIOSA